ncbi:MAG: hypothetical protein WC815_11260 [Vicinamibacterales bacterium]
MDTQIDQLYQLPLDQFTPARNALAKHAGARAPEIKRLEKPNLAAWAVNQLFWRERPIYDELIDASQQLRTAYREQLAGQSPDVRGAEANHRAAVKRATQTAREILEADGGKATAAVIDAVRETLDILPSNDPPGRMTRPLKRTGFEALEGFTIAAKPRPQPTKLEPKTDASRPRPTETEKRANEAARRELDMTRERLRFAEATEREAEATLDRARRAVERAERTRQRIERELAEASKTEKGVLTEQATAQAAYDNAVAERARLTKKLL